MARKVYLCSLVIFTLLMSANIAAGIDVAICTVSYPWPQDVYDQDIAVVTDAIQGVTNLQSFGEDDLDALADWVENHTSDEKSVLILTGIFPSTIYAPGNIEPDGSLIEEFLDAGNTIITTAEKKAVIACI